MFNEMNDKNKLNIKKILQNILICDKLFSSMKYIYTKYKIYLYRYCYFYIYTIWNITRIKYIDFYNIYFKYLNILFTVHRRGEK